MNSFGISEMVLLAVWDWENERKFDSDQLALKVCPTSNPSLLEMCLKFFG
jgi:hypothetical protein